MATEAELSKVIVEILAEKTSGEASIEELIREIPNRIELSEHDRQPSLTRPNEELWEQKVRNIQSHHESSGNYINRGYLEHIDGGYRITPAGIAFIESQPNLDL